MVNLKLSWLRFYRRGSGLGITAIVIMVVQATLIITNASLPLVEAQAVSQKVQSFSVADQWITVNFGDASQLNNPKINEVANSNLAKFGKETPRHFIAYRPVSDQLSGRYQFVGSDQIESEIELTSGQVPKNCSSELCEVVVVGKSGLTQLPTGFVAVGEGKLKSDSPILPTIEAETPLLVTNSAIDASKITTFSGFPGTEIWASKLTDEQVQRFGLKNFLNTANDVRNSLALESGQLQLIAPIGLLEKTKEQINVLLKRIVSLELAICLIGSFAIYLTAGSMRKRNEQFVKSAKRLYPQKVSQQKLDFWTGILATTTGTVLGVAIGTVTFFALNKSFSNIGIDFLTLFVISFTSFLLIFAGLSERNQSKIVLCSFSLFIWSGYVAINNMQPQIALISLAAAGISYLLFRIQNKLFRSKFVKNIFLSSRDRIAALSLVLTFLVTSLLSALSYLNSLQQNAIDNAIFQSPTAIRITMGGEALPMQNNSFADYAKYSTSGEVVSVRKVSTTFQENAIKSFPTQLIGMNPKVWNFVPDITKQTGFDLRNTSELLPNQDSEFGLKISGAKKISALVTGLNEHTTLSIWLFNNRSESAQVELVQSGNNFEANLPTDAISLLGFQITELPDFKSRREHAVGEGINALPVPAGNIDISDVQLDGVAPVEQINVNSEYSVFNGPQYFSLIPKVDSIKAVVDPETADAAKDRQIQLKITNQYSIPIEVVGVANRLPTVRMRFALVNDTALTQVLAARNPELLNVTEVWLQNQLVPNLSKDKELYGLTVLDQALIKHENFSPTNSIWTYRGILLLIASAFVLFALVLWFTANSVFGNPQIFGWIASGKSKKKLQQKLIWRLLMTIGSSLVIATLSAWLLIPFYIEKLSFDINGDVAAPPLVAVFNWQTTGFVVLSLFIFSLLLLNFRAKFQSEKQGD